MTADDPAENPRDGPVAPATGRSAPGGAGEGGGRLPAAAAAALVLRQATKGALGTIDRGSGHPYASLVTVATDYDGTPLLLLSRLALHTQNLEADDRASLLLDASAPDGDPLAGGRVTLIGRCAPTTRATAPDRFLARHPAAEMYAGFADFRYFAFDVERAHYVGGFGRIVDLPPSAFRIDLGDAAALIAAAAGIVAHMNDDHAHALRRMAMAFSEGVAGTWRMTGVDPEGLDLAGPSGAVRLAFPRRVRTVEEAHAVIVDMARAARDRLGDVV